MLLCLSFLSLVPELSAAPDGDAERHDAALRALHQAQRREDVLRVSPPFLSEGSVMVST